MAAISHGALHGHHQYGIQTADSFQRDIEHAIQLSLRDLHNTAWPSTRRSNQHDYSHRGSRQQNAAIQQVRTHTPTASASTRGPARTAEAKCPECAVCADGTTSNDSIAVDCGHNICRDCVAAIFRASMNDRSRFPPRCCSVDKGGQILLASARHLLSDDLASSFENKAKESHTRDGTYCHKPRCSAFIPAQNVKAKNNVETCPRCRAKTCMLCKQETHPGKSCPNDMGQEELEELADSKGWKPCPKCGLMIEKASGCNHVKSVSLSRIGETLLTTRNTGASCAGTSSASAALASIVPATAT